MADNPTPRRVEIKKYGLAADVADGVPDDLVNGPFRDAVIADWRRQLDREGYQPVDTDQPSTELHTRFMAEYVDYEGEMVKLPDRCWRVWGWVVPKGTPPLPPRDGIRFDSEGGEG